MRRKRRRPRGAERPPPPEETLPTLDLHGETADAARLATERWLRGLRADGMPRARVVTGRGTRSVGPPVLLGEIGDLLDGLRGRLIERHALDAGGGAFLVDLLPPPRPARPAGEVRSAGAGRRRAAADAELRRRAEESLAELGVTPTEALVRAEMRRLGGG